VSCRRWLRRQAFCNHTNRETTRAVSLFASLAYAFRQLFPLLLLTTSNAAKQLAVHRLGSVNGNRNLERNLLLLQHAEAFRPLNYIKHRIADGVSTNATPQKGVVYPRMQCVRGKFGHLHSTLQRPTTSSRRRSLSLEKHHYPLQTQDEQFFFLVSK
jgi:hypothetical protein